MRKTVSIVLIVTGVLVAAALFTFPARYAIDGGFFRVQGDCGLPIREAFSPANHENVFGAQLYNPMTRHGGRLIPGDVNGSSCHARSVRQVRIGAGIGLLLVASGIALVVVRRHQPSAASTTNLAANAGV